MKITIIRHAKVYLKNKTLYNSQELDFYYCKYDISPIKIINLNKEFSTNKIFISTLSRTFDTAQMIFTNTNFIKNDFNEVPLKSFIDTSLKFPLFVWNIIGRIQWFLNSNRQKEIKQQTILRSKSAIDLLEKDTNDCTIICHGFFMRILKSELKSRKYKIINDIGVKNLGKIIMEKQ